MIARSLLASLLIAAAGVVAGSAAGPAAAQSPPTQVLAATHATYFVAVNGRDTALGTIDQPWATVNHAADIANAGDMVVVRGGHYQLAAPIRPLNPGRPGAWVTFVGYPGEHVVLDAGLVQRPAQAVLNNGAFQIEGVSHIRVANLAVVNSHDAGFTIRDSSDIDLINNSTRRTFASGIAVWDTNHGRTATHRIRIIGNSIAEANIWDAAGPNVVRRGEPPHEALSVGGAVDFEVADNLVENSDKEGIDIKETSSRGRVHHNVVRNVKRQGIYVDAWFGRISRVELFDNVVRDCGGSGFALSAENGRSVERVGFRRNLVFENRGSGFYFSRWGADHVRRKIRIVHNTFYHNGYGPPAPGQAYFWQTGGLYLYSTSIRDIEIRSNIFSENRGFQIGYSELFLKPDRSWAAAARAQKIDILDNLIDGRDQVVYPIESGGAPADRVKIYAVDGRRPRHGNPMFKDPATPDFSLLHGSPAVKNGVAAGAIPASARHLQWWKQNFPPNLVRTNLRLSG